MTPKTTGIATQARRKTTPTASKAWKEKLRRACVERAGGSSGRVSTRLVVQEELQQQGIVLQSPCTTTTRNPGELSDQMEVVTCTVDGTSEKIEPPMAHHFITEAELFELLEEVEHEIEKAEAERLDEMICQVQNEQLYLQDQVAEYEQWEERQQQQANLSDHQLEPRNPLEPRTVVLCPICQEEDLLETRSDHTIQSIICPNHMGVSCTMHLENPAVHSLNDLQNRIRAAFDEHNGPSRKTHCDNNHLSFHVRENRLLATCGACGTSMTLV